MNEKAMRPCHGYQMKFVTLFFQTPQLKQYMMGQYIRSCLIISVLYHDQADDTVSTPGIMESSSRTMLSHLNTAVHWSNHSHINTYYSKSIVMTFF